MSKNKVWEMAPLLKDEPFDYVEFSVQSWREWIAKAIAETEKVELREVKLLTYFSILEMMAQEFHSFPQRDLQDSFSQFVLRFQSCYNFLDDVDPITLYYREESTICSEVNLNDMVNGSVYDVNDSIISDKLKQIECVLKDNKGEEYALKKLKQHRYVELLYRMRCRLSHEFSATHISPNKLFEEPYYINCSRQYVKEGRLVNDDVWQLQFPVIFVKKLCLNCFENYMTYCLEERVPPNKNNGLDRSCELSWYNK